MTATVDDLLARVLAVPSDLEARRVYADALLERGDPRGELIQLELELPSLRGDAAWEARERIYELLRRHRWRWVAPLSAFLNAPIIRLQNGFLERVTMSPAVLAARAEALTRMTPLREVTLVQITSEGLRALLDQPVLGQLEGISLTQWWGIEAEERRLLGELIARLPRLRRLSVPAELAHELVPRARELEELALGGQGSEPIDALFVAPQVARLEKLALNGSLLRIEALAAAAFAAGLRELRLANLNAKAGRALAAGSWPALRDLALDDLGVDGAAAVLASPGLAGVERLSFSNLRGTGWPKALGGATLPALTDLSFQSVELRAVGARALAKASGGALARLEKLALRGCRLDGEAAAALATVSLPSLRGLALDGNPLGDEGVVALAKGALLAPVRDLSLTEVGVKQRGLTALGKSPKLAELRTLTIHSNAVDRRGAETLLEKPQLGRLKWLHADAKVMAVAARRFAEGALPELRELRAEDVEDDDLVRALARCPRMPQLGFLIFERVRCSAAAAEELAASPHVRGIGHVILMKTNFPAAALDAMAASLGDRLEVS